MKSFSVKPLTYRHGRTRHPKLLVNLIGLAYQSGNIKLIEISEGLGLSYRTLKAWKRNGFYLHEFEGRRREARGQRELPKLLLRRVREFYKEAERKKP